MPVRNIEEARQGLRRAISLLPEGTLKLTGEKRPTSPGTVQVTGDRLIGKAAELTTSLRLDYFALPNGDRNAVLLLAGCFGNGRMAQLSNHKSKYGDSTEDP